jgi:hypothetical protein
MKMICYTFKKNPCAGFSISLIGAFTLGYINIINLKFIRTKLGINFFYYRIISVQYFVLTTVNKIAAWLINQEKITIT